MKDAAFVSDVFGTNWKLVWKKYIFMRLSVIRSTNSLILRTDIYCILRNYSKDVFSNLPSSHHVWYELAEPIANHNAKVLQTLLKHAFVSKQLRILLEKVKKHLTVIKMWGFHPKSEDSRGRIASKFKTEKRWTSLGMTFRRLKQF